jgi:DNA-binding CsgD family transcriptional regulator
MSVGARGGAAVLLEREEARERLLALAAASVGGHGSVAAIVGAPGEGKTALLREAAALGARAGLTVWRAYGSDLEGSFAFGVVRQLLQPAVMSLGQREREGMFTGVTRLAAGVLDMDQRRQALDPFAAQQGLYWLLVDLARRGPLMLLVDDAHWADQPSLRWLASLPRRVEELGVLVVLAARPPAFDGAGDALAALLSDAQVPLLRVAPLGRPSVAELARRELEAEPEQSFLDACHHATGGNPLAVIELLRDLRREGGELDSERSARLGDRAPEAIERHVRGRLDRLGSDAVEVAQALAVLGDGAPLRQVAALADVELERAGRLIDALNLAGIVDRAAQLRFEHPLVHAAVHDSMTHRWRAALHARAATLLAAEQSDPESIAAHLLNADPAGNPRRVTWLRAAGAAALRRGSPEGAVIYLERALAEPPPAQLRSELLGELGRAVWAALDTSAIEHLQAARELTADASERARLDLMLAEVCLYGGERDRLFTVLERGLADLGQQDPGLALELRAMRTTALAAMDAGWPAADDAEHERLAELAGAGSDTGRQLQLSLALVRIWTGRGTAPETIAMVEAALDERILERADAGSASRLAHGLFALIFADELERASELASRMMARAAADGSPMMLGLASHAHGWAQLRRGALADAEASGRLATEAAIETRARFADPFTRAPLGEVLIERGRLKEAAEVLTGVPPDLDARAVNFFMGIAMARLYRARGLHDAAIAELETLGAEASRHGMHNPAVLPWRSELALLIAPGSPEQAKELVDGELADARQVKLPRAVGVALRARAACESGAVREATLHEAVAELEASPARLDLARALVDLGGHLRRGGRRSAARAPLRRALELAHQCGAEPLIALAGDELRAADGRPRSPWLTGAAALTPSELRVARLAATGLSNQQVAEALFITIKTVEMHLTSAYRKLGGGSRAELPRLLEGELANR